MNIRKIRTPPCHAYIPHNRGSNDEDDQVPHRTQFRTKEDNRSDDRCEPYRLHHLIHNHRVYKRDKGVSEFSEFSPDTFDR